MFGKFFDDADKSSCLGANHRTRPLCLLDWQIPGWVFTLSAGRPDCPLPPLHALFGEARLTELGNTSVSFQELRMTCHAAADPGLLDL